MAKKDNNNVNRELENILEKAGGEKKKLSKKKKLIISSVAVILATAIAVGTVFIIKSKKSSSTQTVYREYTAQRGDILVGLSESSVITLEKENIEFPVGAEVLELYVKSGADVKKGDKLVKMSTDDIDESLTEYEQQLSEAKSDLDTAILNRKSELEKAKSSLESSLLSANQADDKYSQTVLSAKLSLVDAQTAYDEAKESYEEAQSQNKTFSKDLKKLNKLDTALDDAQDTYDYWQKLQTEYNTITKNIDSVSSRIKELTNFTCLDDYEDNLDEKEDELAAMVVGINEPESTITIDDIKELRSEISDLKSNLTELEELFTKLDDLEDEREEYDSVNIALKLSSASTALENAKENYNEFYDDFTDTYGKITTCDEMDDTLSKAKTAYNKAKLALDEQKTAYDEALLKASQTQSESKETGSTAQETYDLKKLELDQKVSTAQTAYDEIKDELDEIKESIGNNGVITAPCDGVISSINVEEGDEISSGNDIFSTSVIMTITQMSNVNVSVTITEDEILEVSLGGDAVVTLSAFDGESFDATIDSISVEGATMGAATVTYTVNVAFTQQGHELYDGMSADVTLIQGAARDCVYIQKSAITTEDGAAYVNLKGSDGNPVKTKVVTGFTDGQYTEILSGLSEGDIVLSESALGAGSAGGAAKGADNKSADMPSGFDGQMPDFGNMGQMPGFFSIKIFGG